MTLVFIDDQQLAKEAKTRNGRLRIASGLFALLILFIVMFLTKSAIPLFAMFVIAPILWIIFPSQVKKPPLS